MIDERVIAEFLTRMRKVRGDQYGDIRELIHLAYKGEGPEGNAAEIAKTLCEIVEPERLGPIMSLTCDKCMKFLPQPQRSPAICAECF